RLIAKHNNGDTAGLQVQVVDVLVWWDRHERALSILSQALDVIAEPHVDLLRATGDLLSAIGEFERAILVLESAHGLDPRKAGIDEGLSWAYSNIDNPPVDKLMASVERALQRSPADPWMLKAKAEALLQSGRSDLALPIYTEVLEHRLRTLNWKRDRHSLA